MLSNKMQLALMLGFSGYQGMVRYQSREMIDGVGKNYVYREFDPRGRDVESYRKRTERAFFKFKDKFSSGVSWPGLTALDFSLTWLRILVSTYDEASAEGDFSWLFHKLSFISSLVPQSDSTFQSAMLPYFAVLGNDPAGALYLFNDKLDRNADKNDWRVCYWAGYHALMNLNEKKLAGDLFLRAAALPGSPNFLTPLGFRLSQGDDLDQQSMRREAIKKLSPELSEKLRALRPEWFR